MESKELEAILNHALSRYKDYLCGPVPGDLLHGGVDPKDRIVAKALAAVTAEVERARLEARLHFIEQLRGNAEINPDPDTSNGWIGDSLLDWLDSEAERLQPQPQKGQV